MKIRTGFVSNSSSSSFAILGFTVTDAMKEKAKKIASAEKEVEYWCCPQCGTEPNYGARPKFCDECGAEMHTATRIEEVFDYELFETIGLSYYAESEYGDVAGFDVDGKTAEQVIELHNKLVEELGEGTYKILVGEYAC